jgi:hypothetical protein
MRRSSLRHAFLAALIGTFAVCTISFAAPVKLQEAWATGRIDRFDPASKVLVVKQGQHEMTFTLAPDARVMQKKATLQPTALATSVGHRVKVGYTMNAGTKIANRIDVSGAAAKAPATN